MKDFKRYIALLVCAVFLLGAGFIIWQWFPAKKTDQIIQEKEASRRLMKNAAHLQSIWIEGEDSRGWSLIRKGCLNFLKITADFDESLLRCNPLLLQCYAQFSKDQDYRFISPVSGGNKLYRYMAKSNSDHIGLTNTGYLFTIEDIQTKKRLSFMLADQCHEIFLENRIYAYGEEAPQKGFESEDFRFDNFGFNIYVDRHLVTNANVNEWLDFGNPELTKGLVKKNGNDLFLPATHLQLQQMKNYCAFKEKQLLLAHIFDAATFMPQDLNDPSPVNNTRSPYFWAKKKKEFKEDCALIFAEECLLKNNYKLNSTGPSWSGLMDPMGGVMEVFRNPIDPESNLKASSYYFNFKSSWHRLGFRAHWDGEGFGLRHFDFRGISPDKMVENYQVGFRCMEETK